MNENRGEENSGPDVTSQSMTQTFADAAEAAAAAPRRPQLLMRHRAKTMTTTTTPMTAKMTTTTRGETNKGIDWQCS